ncbi:KpsF/GutQ family sugar-phosphate isomerase [Glaciecola siphonariae]|uniref:Arabinose 5-phosphate isomerase n=1 Tax=Glaciecola siphonariae TaxID=521012 RepID=A0ABV9LZN3_9ALTE
MSYLSSAQRTFSIQVEALKHLNSMLDEQFTESCELLKLCKGKVVVSGMGKSGHIANKIAATLASTGTPAFFMHPGEANHGDFGMLSKDDILIAISNSGETGELIGLLPAVKRLNIPIIAITNKPNSSLSKFATKTLLLHVNQEACSLGLAPTTSTTATLVLGDALAIALLEAKGFTAEDFAFSHPGGALGKRLLLTVNDIMVTGSEIPLVNSDASLSETLLEMSSKGMGFAAIVEQNKVIGIYTDGDLRRTLDKQINVHTTGVVDVMTANGVTLSADDLAVNALNLMQEKRITALVVVDDDMHAVGALNMHMLLKAGVV